MTATIVKARPLIMTGESVRRTLDGVKRQTRRVVNVAQRDLRDITFPNGTRWLTAHERDPLGLLVQSPFGYQGDHLWVRESHYRWTGCGEAPESWVRSPDHNVYQSRGYIGDGEDDALHGRSASAVLVTSILMPRWASRLTLEITDVRVERLQAISEEDALAEGIEHLGDTFGGYWSGGALSGPTARACYARLWDQLNAKRGFSWDSNPYVWVLSYTVLPSTQEAA